MISLRASTPGGAPPPLVPRLGGGIFRPRCRHFRAETIYVLTAEKRQVKFRRFGLLAPETSEGIGSRAKQAASALALSQTMTIQEDDKDRDGRTVAEVILAHGRSPSREMVGLEMAW